MSKIKFKFYLIIIIFLAPGNLLLASEITGTLNTDPTDNFLKGVIIASPVAEPVPGSYVGTQSIILKAPGSLSIRYRVDGQNPDCAAATLYAAPISVSSSLDIKAIACYQNNKSSGVAAFSYKIETAPPSVNATSGGGLSGGGGGGGGGISVNYCAKVFYGEWGACLNGVKQRQPINREPSGCVLTTDQQLNTSANCVMPQVLSEKIEQTSAKDARLEQILNEAQLIWSANLNNILTNANLKADENKEKKCLVKFLNPLIKGTISLAGLDKNRLNYFIAYGTASAKPLGEGERSGALNSYKSAYGKLPLSLADWQDAIKIANGRWPSLLSAKAEQNAGSIFKKIYGRAADMKNKRDEMAIKILAYGLRPAQRNMNSEKNAIKSFKYYFKRNPASAVDWDAVRAIAYSGAKR